MFKQKIKKSGVSAVVSIGLAIVFFVLSPSTRVFGAESSEYIDNIPRPADRADDTNFLKKIKGYFLFDTSKSDDIWYINPTTARRYYMGRPYAAFKTISQQGIGISNANLKKIPTDKDTFPGDFALRKKMAGRILLQFQHKGEAWYVNPKNLKRYYLGKPSVTLSVIRRLGIETSNNTITKIPSRYRYEFKKIITAQGSFNTEILEIDLTDSRLNIISDTASDKVCDDNCPTKPLQDFVKQNKAIAGIIGTYFCPQEYSDCSDHDGACQWMIYNNPKNIMINEARNKTNNGSLIVFDNKQRSYFYLHTRDFEGKEAFEKKYDAKITAAVSNWPALRNNSENVLDVKSLDQKQLTIRGNRSAIGLKGNKAYFIAVRGGTVPNLSSVVDELNLEYALNLDGGGFYFEGNYIIGPGRSIPNAIVVAER